MVARVGTIVAGAFICSVILNIFLILLGEAGSEGGRVINVIVMIVGGVAGNRLYDMRNGLPDPSDRWSGRKK